MLILGTNIEIIKSTKRMLPNNFNMKDLGIADVILGIKITRTPDGISLSQSHYVDKMIERFKGLGIKENTNPFLSHIHLHKKTGTRIRQLEYSQIIRSLMYLMNCTRPDIAYAVSKLSDTLTILVINIGLLYYEYWFTYHIPRNMLWDMDSISTCTWRIPWC